MNCNRYVLVPTMFFLVYFLIKFDIIARLYLYNFSIIEKFKKNVLLNLDLDSSNLLFRTIFATTMESRKEVAVKTAEIDQLIFEEIENYQTKKKNEKQKEKEQRDAALELVETFITNETLASFRRKEEKDQEKLKKKKKKKTKNLPEEKTSSPVVSSTVKKKNKKMEGENTGISIKKSKRIKANWEKLEDETSMAEVKEIKSEKKTKAKKNRVKPVNERKTEKKKKTKVENVEGSLLTFIILGMTLDGEYPAGFYAHLLESENFKWIVSNLSEEQKKLLIAMTSDTDIKFEHSTFQQERLLEFLTV